VVGLDESVSRVVNADKSEGHSEEDDEAVEDNFPKGKTVSFQLQMEVARPNEA